jgi:hypothetical protein
MSQTGRALLWNNVVSMIEFDLCKVTKWCSRIPDNTLRPCTRLERLVDGSHKVRPRGVSRWRFILWLVGDLVFPVSQQDEVERAVVERYWNRGIDPSMLSLESCYYRRLLDVLQKYALLERHEGRGLCFPTKPLPPRVHSPPVALYHQRLRRGSFLGRPSSWNRPIPLRTDVSRPRMNLWRRTL